MRIFLDSNVLVAAFLTRGLCAQLVALVIEHHELIISDQVLDEVRRILIEKMRSQPADVEELLAMLRERAGEATPPQPREPPEIEIEVRDPTDAPLVKAAIAGGADFLVSGDRDLLEAALPIRVLSPRELWQVLRGTSQPDTVHEPAERFGAQAGRLREARSADPLLEPRRGDADEGDAQREQPEVRLPQLGQSDAFEEDAAHDLEVMAQRVE